MCRETCCLCWRQQRGRMQVDLVIPRGSHQLLTHVEKNTKIPILGDSEGVCHVYVHSDATLEAAQVLRITEAPGLPSILNPDPRTLNPVHHTALLYIRPHTRTATNLTILECCATSQC